MDDAMLVLIGKRREQFLEKMENSPHSSDLHHLESVKKQYGEEAYFKALDKMIDYHENEDKKHALYLAENERVKGLTDDEAVAEMLELNGRLRELANRVQNKGLTIEWVPAKAGGGYEFKVSRPIRGVVKNG